MNGYRPRCTKLHVDQVIWLLPKETKSKHYNVQKEGMWHPVSSPPAQGEENFSCATHRLEWFYLTNVGDTPQPAVLSLRYTLILWGLELLLSLQLFWPSRWSAKHLEILAWPKDAISINKLEEIGTVPSNPCFVLQVITCACNGSLCNPYVHQHIPQWDHTCVLLDEAGNHDTWSSPHDPFWCSTLFAVQIQNCFKTQHTCTSFLPSASRESSELSISPTLPFHSMFPTGKAETFYFVSPVCNEQLCLQSVELHRRVVPRSWTRKAKFP